MFTGIVQAVGRIVEVRDGPAAARLRIDADSLPVDDVAPGDSIAVNGCCLTVVDIGRPPSTPQLTFDVSTETLACTAGLDRPGAVNLEKALRLADRLGGHLMTGHVDGVGRVAVHEAVAGESGGRRLVVDLPAALARFVATKGSIALNGVSLTVNAVDGARFEVNLIPHTLAATTLGALGAGDRVNVEVDLVARYVARLHEAT
jgi:riboflavin synthase